MPRNGTGTYSLPAGNPVSNGSVASSANFNSTMSDLATALTNSVAKNGQTVAAADLPMGGYKHTNVANASARNQYATAGQLQDGAFLVLGSVSGTNAITATATPAVTALVTGQAFRFKSAGQNTGGVTLAVDGLSAVSVKKFGVQALTTGDIASAGYVQVVYDGSEFQLLNPTVSANLPDTATQSEMETGTESGVRQMSPLRVKQALPATASQAEMEAGTETALRSMSPLRVKQAIDALGGKLTRMTKIDSTSGTTVDFTGIPSTARRITIMFDGVSLNGTSQLMVRIGDSGGIEDGANTYAGMGITAPSGYAHNSTGFLLSGSSAASLLWSGLVTLSNLTDNTWCEAGIIASSANNYIGSSAGSKTLSATLDRVRILAANATDTFDGGAINLFYE